MDELNCGMVRDLLPSYDEDLLHESVRDAVAEHLAGCPACAAVLNGHRQRMRTAKLLGTERDRRFRESASEMRAYWKGFIGAFLLSLIVTVIAVVVILPLVLFG